VNYAEKSHLNTLVWAGVHDLHLSFKDAGNFAIESLSIDTLLDVHNTVTGFSHMKEKNPSMDLKEELDQFIMRFIEVRFWSFSNLNDWQGELLCEQIVRLQNGYPTTEREAKAFDARQEENLQKLAQVFRKHLQHVKCYSGSWNYNWKEEERLQTKTKTQ
jgi:hypothetical protein